MKNAVYFVSFEDPKPSINEIEEIRNLFQGFQVEAYFFLATQVELESWIEGGIYDEEGKFDPSRLKSYFAFKPITIPKDPESELEEGSSD